MSFWSQPDHAHVLLELLISGGLRRRKRQAAALAQLESLGWTRRAVRSDRVELVGRHREQLAACLDGAWPEWREIAADLARLDLPPTPGGMKELAQRRRAARAAGLALPERLNRHTAAALVGRHSKAALGPFEQVVFDRVDLTDDGLVRMRPSRALSLATTGGIVDACELADLLGEVVLTERALRDGTRLAGARPRAVLTVENLGAYIDAWVPDDVLVVHIPGWNTRLARLLLEPLRETPLVHFGDLDPNGVAIVEHLRLWRDDVDWLVPACWEELRGTHGLRRVWPHGVLPEGTPDWVCRLVSDGLWLEQEPLVVHEGWPESLASALGERPSRNGPGGA